jgi:hypothetical protein
MIYIVNIDSNHYSKPTQRRGKKQRLQFAKTKRMDAEGLKIKKRIRNNIKEDGYERLIPKAEILN